MAERGESLEDPLHFLSSASEQDNLRWRGSESLMREQPRRTSRADSLTREQFRRTSRGNSLTQEQLRRTSRADSLTLEQLRRTSRAGDSALTQEQLRRISRSGSMTRKQSGRSSRAEFQEQLRRGSRDSLTVEKLSSKGSSTSVTSQRSGSRSPLPAWKCPTVNLRSPSPPPPSPTSFKMTSMMTAWFGNLFKLQKVDPTGVRPVDAKCNENHVPIVYNKQYDIHGSKKLGLPKQPMLFDKPAQIFSVIKGKVLNKYKHFTEVDDISTQFDLFNLVSDAIRSHDVKRVAESMKLTLSPSSPMDCTWEAFDSTMLSPLRVQMMGSVMACKLALDEGWAINIGGGFSHYTTNTGGGLAVYDDVLVCLAIASSFPEVSNLLVINTDAYQSSDYRLARNVNCPVTVIDFYSNPICEDIGYANMFCQEVTYIGYEISADNEMTNTIGAYMVYFHRMVKKHLERLDTLPSLCIYIAGTTLLANNPYTNMKFSIQDIVKRDQTVVEMMKQYKIPIAMLLGGGYQHYDVKASSASIINLWNSKILEKHSPIK